ncbi:uncharacterized protein LOC109919656 isoform X2 [Rhincodon typus]|uniref:uncharacterized protein LOC109919656 isoform X2 n=1 Tax=Rhincodon typus TaxID=259920 RepID=UPI00202FF3FD|nr:uncharacterized protein LOC109919656 isoform X2 [Rhincodon typus]
MSECGLCLRSGESRETGKLFTDGPIAAHQNCLLYSSNLVSHDSDFEDFGGFLVEDIKKEIKRGSKLKCSSCRKKGATVGCEVKMCRRSYHYPCAIHDEAAVIEDNTQGIYRIYCKAHKKAMENPSLYGNSHSNNAGSDTDDDIVTVEENNLPAASNHRKSQPGPSTNDNWRTTTVRKRVFSSDTDESDDLPIFTGFYVKTPVQSHEAKQRKLENDDQMQDKERRSQSDTVAENETDPSNEHSPSLFREVGLQSGQGRTQLNESNSTRNVHLDSRAISDENEPNDANCSDASTNLDQQQEGQEEIVDVQQEVRRQMTEDTPCTSRNLCSTGQANTFWKKCKEAKCVEMIFKKMQNDLNAIQQNIINGSATDKEYDNAWTIFLTLDSLQVLEEFQSETLQKLQLLEKEKSSLKIKECLVQEMRKIAGSLNHKSHREK